jgi:hypothetical protein
VKHLKLSLLLLILCSAATADEVSSVAIFVGNAHPTKTQYQAEFYIEGTPETVYTIFCQKGAPQCHLLDSYVCRITRPQDDGTIDIYSDNGHFVASYQTASVITK